MGVAFMMNPAFQTTALTKIGTSTLSGAASSISFASIASGYGYFLLTWLITPTSNALRTGLTLNNDTGNNYAGSYIVAGGGGAAGGNVAATSSAPIATFTAPSTPVNGFAYILNKADVYKEIISFSKAGEANNYNSEWETTTWRNGTDEISRIDLIARADTFAAKTRATLWGGV